MNESKRAMEARQRQFHLTRPVDGVIDHRVESEKLGGNCQTSLHPLSLSEVVDADFQQVWELLRHVVAPLVLGDVVVAELLQRLRNRGDHRRVRLGRRPVDVTVPA